jgi:hypothetical protein
MGLDYILRTLTNALERTGSTNHGPPTSHTPEPNASFCIPILRVALGLASAFWGAAVEKGASKLTHKSAPKAHLFVTNRLNYFSNLILK